MYGSLVMLVHMSVVTVTAVIASQHTQRQPQMPHCKLVLSVQLTRSCPCDPHDAADYRACTLHGNMPLYTQIHTINFTYNLMVLFNSCTLLYG